MLLCSWKGGLEQESTCHVVGSTLRDGGKPIKRTRLSVTALVFYEVEIGVCLWVDQLGVPNILADA